MINKNYTVTELIVRIILPYIIMTFTAYSCEKEPQNQDCDENSIIETYSNISGKIFINNQYFTNEGDTAYIYSITISMKDFYSDNVTFFHSEPWMIDTDSILVPLNLPENFKIDNLRIIFSCDKLNCCKVLTQPNWRVGYGCNCRITDIKLY